MTGSDWLTAVDDVSVAVLNFLEVEASDNQSNDPIGQHFSDSLEAIQHFTNGHVALDIDNDYPQGIAELQSAVEIDPEFAEANGVLSTTHYLNSDLESARATASQALKNELSTVRDQQIRSQGQSLYFRRRLRSRRARRRNLDAGAAKQY